MTYVFFPVLATMMPAIFFTVVIVGGIILITTLAIAFVATRDTRPHSVLYDLGLPIENRIRVEHFDTKYEAQIFIYRLKHPEKDYLYYPDLRILRFDVGAPALRDYVKMGVLEVSEYASEEAREYYNG